MSPEEPFPEKTRRPKAFLKKRVTICQGVTMARLYGWTVGLAKEDIVCAMTQDDELVVAFPARFLPALAQGLEEAGRKIGARYPVTFYQNFEPEFPAPYKGTAQRLGLFDED